MKYSTKLLIANCIPIAVFATISLILGFLQFQSSLYDEKQGNFMTRLSLDKMPKLTPASTLFKNLI